MNSYRLDGSVGTAVRIGKGIYNIVGAGHCGIEESSPISVVSDSVSFKKADNRCPFQGVDLFTLAILGSQAKETDHRQVVDGNR